MRVPAATAHPDKQASRVKLQATFDGPMRLLKAAQQDPETRHKPWFKLLDTTQKGLRARQSVRCVQRQARPRVEARADGYRFPFIPTTSRLVNFSQIFPAK